MFNYITQNLEYIAPTGLGFGIGTDAIDMALLRDWKDEKKIIRNPEGLVLIFGKGPEEQHIYSDVDV